MTSPYTPPSKLESKEGDVAAQSKEAIQAVLQVEMQIIQGGYEKVRSWKKLFQEQTSPKLG